MLKFKQKFPALKIVTPKFLSRTFSHIQVNINTITHISNCISTETINTTFSSNVTHLLYNNSFQISRINLEIIRNIYNFI